MHLIHPLLLLALAGGLTAQTFEVLVNRGSSPVIVQTRVEQSLPERQVNYDTRLGTVEMVSMAAVTVLPYGLGAKPAFIISNGVAFNRVFSAHGEYTYSWVLNERVRGLSATADFMDYGAALMAQVPSGSRVVPYAIFGIGNSRARVLDEVGSSFHFNCGGGVKVHITRNMGVRFDFRGYKADRVAWYGRAGIGVFYQPNR